MLPSELGVRLRSVRELAGLSARELAVLANLAPSLVGHIELGRVQHPRAETLAELARVLGVSLDWLIRGEGDGPSTDCVQAAVAGARSLRRTESEGADCLAARGARR